MNKKVLLVIMVVGLYIAIQEILLSINPPPEPQFYDESEIGFKIMYEKSDNLILAYQYKPNFTTEYRPYLQTNSFRIRDYEYSLKKPINTFRIAVLGDSITASIDLPLNKTYPKLLEQALKSSEEQIEVINFGIDGYSSIQEYELLKQKVYAFEPNMIIIQFFLNDLVHSPRPLRYFVNESEEYKSREKMISASLSVKCKLKNYFKNTNFIKYSKTINLIKNAFLRNEDYFHSISRNNCYWERINYAYKGILEITEENNMTLFVVVYPALENFQDYQFIDIHKKIGNILDENNIEYIDLLLEFSKYPASQLRIKPEDTIHPNELGHKIAAEAIYQKLVEDEALN